MARIAAPAARGEVFLDARDGGRALRVSWHHERSVDHQDSGGSGVVVLSVWREHTCVATFRLEEDEVPRFVDALVSGLVARHATSA